MANFKDIMALCLDGASYAAISAALGWRVSDGLCVGIHSA